ncbi:MAG: ATP-dependent DNA helicase [Candidatus Lokiarchaeota archaeon]|nr:ATP-dependent DNA helicase [Candidatus Lokiarchaeota archaeon]
MKVIKDQREFHISIKEVVYASSERRFSTSVIPLRLRASIGTEAHQSFQESRKKTEKSFQREVFVKFHTEIQGWKFIISGRADIVYEKEGVLIIEEIKSVLNLKEFSLESKIAEEYRLQLLLYGHYFLTMGKSIQCRLVLIDIYTEKTKIIDIPPQDLSEFIQEKCETILNSWEMEQKLNTEQRKRAKTIIFPFEKYRPNQEDIIQKTTQCLQNRGRLMLLAPSGLGKTIGTLFPALKYSLKKNKRLFVITSKTTQQHIYRDTLKLFTKKKAKFNSIILTAKEKMCINGVFICEKSLCPYLENYEKVSLGEIVSEVITKQVIDARYIKKVAKIHKVCPFELSLDCSLYCDVIVGDYNYVFHPFIKLKRFFDQPYDDIILIVDEAHNLPTRAMTYYSPEITLQSLNDVIDYLQSLRIPKSIEKKGIAIYQQVTDYISNLITQFPDVVIKKPVLEKFDKIFFQKVLKESDQFILEYVQAINYQRGIQPGGKDKLIQFALNLRQFSTILKESDSPEYSELLYVTEGKIKMLCKSAAPKLEKQIAGFHSVIMQSATLFPLDYFQKMLGYPPSAQKIQYDSPFAQQNRLYLLMPNLSTKYENRGESYDDIASIIVNVVKVKNGNYLAFFPSFGYLKAVQREIETYSLSVELIVQERKMSERKRKNLLKKLQNPDEKYLLLAVHGGIFSEGVDYTGDMAIGAFVIGPGLPAYSMEQELMRKYFDFKWKKGFEYAYRNPGMLKVIQAAGRIFRTSTDRGFVMLIGHRFSTPYYKNLFPTDWKIEHPPDLIKRIQTFWATQTKNVTLKDSSLGVQLEKPKKIQGKYPKTVDLFDYMEKL